MFAAESAVTGAWHGAMMANTLQHDVTGRACNVNTARSKIGSRCGVVCFTPSRMPSDGARKGIKKFDSS